MSAQILAFPGGAMAYAVRAERGLHWLTSVKDSLAEDIVRVAGVTSTKAQAIAQAMAAGSVRHVSVEF